MWRSTTAYCENVSRTTSIFESPRGDYYTKDVGTWRTKEQDSVYNFRDGREEVALIALRRHCRRDFGRLPTLQLVGYDRNEDEQPVNGALRGSVLVGFRPAGVHSAQSSE